MSILPSLTGDLSSISVNNIADSVGSSIGTSMISNSISNTFSSASSGVSSIESAATEVISVVGTRHITDLRIKLVPKNKTSVLGTSSTTNPLSPLIATGGLIFPYTPHISVSGAANYTTQTPTQTNQDYKIYQNTPSQTFTISSSLTARSLEEAEYSASVMHFLSTIVKTRFGKSSDAGLPPPVMYLNGYGTFMFNMLPVIVTNYTYDLPEGVDYVNATIGNMTAKVPTLTTFSVTVVVQNTPDKLNTFDIDQFAHGSLIRKGGWF